MKLLDKERVSKVRHIWITSSQNCGCAAQVRHIILFQGLRLITWLKVNWKKCMGLKAIAIWTAHRNNVHKWSEEPVWPVAGLSEQKGGGRWVLLLQHCSLLYHYGTYIFFPQFDDSWGCAFNHISHWSNFFLSFLNFLSCGWNGFVPWICALICTVSKSHAKSETLRGLTHVWHLSSTMLFGRVGVKLVK